LLVLFYTPFFDRAPERPQLDDVEFAFDKALLPLADVVIVHLPDCAKHWRMRRYPGQIWVAWSQESSVNYPLMADLAFMRQFDLTMTYQSDADVWVPYLPLLSEWERIRETPPARQEEAAAVAAFISNGADHAGRGKLFADLAHHVRIDSYGGLLNNRRAPADDGGGASKRRLLARYPFCLAFENSIGPDYVTEKVFDALSAGSIPVYLGAPSIVEFVPKGCYIDASAYPSARELGAYLNYLAMHPEATRRYHAWRAEPLPAALIRRIASVERPAFQRLVDLCRERRGSRPIRRQLPAITRAMDAIRVKLRRIRGLA
jgi:alpha-1,3-fucosyltransferase 10